jgi:hypothetical protein
MRSKGRSETCDIGNKICRLFANCILENARLLPKMLLLRLGVNEDPPLLYRNLRRLFRAHLVFLMLSINIRLLIRFHSIKMKM